MALTGKAKKDTYKDLLYLNNSNNGVPATTPTSVEDGAGNKTAAKISQDKVLIQPNTNDTSDAFRISDSGGNAALTINSSTRLVQVNTTQDFANTQYKNFYALQLSAVANTWYAIGDGNSDPTTGITLGTSSTPATTLTASYKGVLVYWYIHDNITIDSIKVFHMGDDSASTDSLAYVLAAYTLDTSGAGAGDLSSGVYHCSSSSQTIDNADMDQHALTITTANIDAGKVALMLVRGGSTINNDISCQVSIKYHIR